MSQTIILEQVKQRKDKHLSTEGNEMCGSDNHETYSQKLA
jgi:hypothetical protein